MSLSLGWILFMTFPSMEISPLEIDSKPAVIRSKVVLPQPDGPNKTTNFWLSILRLISFNTSTEPKFFLIFLY